MRLGTINLCHGQGVSWPMSDSTIEYIEEAIATKDTEPVSLTLRFFADAVNSFDVREMTEEETEETEREYERGEEWKARQPQTIATLEAWAVERILAWYEVYEYAMRELGRTDDEDFLESEDIAAQLRERLSSTLVQQP